jgi:tRNA-splicing ligase RtcB
MADPGYIVMGRGEPASLQSASHGGGRQMSRNAAKKNITAQQHMDYLTAHGVTLIGGGLDEAPQAYKAITDVIGAQADLVEILGTFQPRLVRMAADEGPLRQKRRGNVPSDVVMMEGD